MRIKNPLVTSICVGRNGFEIMNNIVNTCFLAKMGNYFHFRNNIVNRPLFILYNFFIPFFFFFNLKFSHQWTIHTLTVVVDFTVFIPNIWSCPTFLHFHFPSWIVQVHFQIVNFAFGKDFPCCVFSPLMWKFTILHWTLGKIMWQTPNRLPL